MSTAAQAERWSTGKSSTDTHVHPLRTLAATISDDPLAHLLAELANTVRKTLRLREKDVRAKLEDDQEGPDPWELDRQLSQKRAALETMASHAHANTTDGAILQALVALDVELPALSDNLPLGFLSSPEGAEFRDIQARIKRMLYSIAYSSDAICDDLRMLRDDMAPRSFDVLAKSDELDTSA